MKNKKENNDFDDFSKRPFQEDGRDAFIVDLEANVDQITQLIDSRDSFHMTSHWDQFSMHEKYDGQMIHLSVDFPLIIVGCGTVFIKVPTGSVKGINGVFHILDLA